MYVLDLSGGKTKFAPVGNFRKYMTTILTEFIYKIETDEIEDEEECLDEAKNALGDLKKFSRKMVEKNSYRLKINDQ